MEGVKKQYIAILSIILFASFIINSSFMIDERFYIKADNGDISEAWYNDSSLSVEVIVKSPQIWNYTFQYWNDSSGGWESRIDQQIDVDNKYRFVFTVVSYQGWDDIETINLTAWYDQGNDSSSYYNQTPGGNFNMKMQYVNTSATGNSSEFNYLWPKNDEEVTYVNSSERNVTDCIAINWSDTEAKNISFEFIPGLQFRYAPGPSGGWNTNTSTPHNTAWSNLFNNYSWNFNISVTDSGENNSGVPINSWVTDEFGVYSYTEICSAGNPYIRGYPGDNQSVNDDGGSGNVTIETRSNGKYSLSANLSDLQHQNINVTDVIDNDTVWLRGGDAETFTNFSKGSNSQPIYLYGGGVDGLSYHQAEAFNNSKITDDLEYKCKIPTGILPGVYESTIYYRLRTHR